VGDRGEEEGRKTEACAQSKAGSESTQGWRFIEVDSSTQSTSAFGRERTQRAEIELILVEIGAPVSELLSKTEPTASKNLLLLY
jgi:hypothetical protein